MARDGRGERMRVNVHIERLVLDGLSIQGRDGAAVGAALQSELKRLLATGVFAQWQATAVPSMSAPPLTLGPSAGTKAIGRGVADCIGSALTRA